MCRLVFAFVFGLSCSLVAAQVVVFFAAEAQTIQRNFFKKALRTLRLCGLLLILSLLIVERSHA